MTGLGIFLAIVSLAITVTIVVALVRIWQILNEIIDSGALPKVLEARAKKEARQILEIGRIHYPEKLESVMNVLSGMTEDREANKILHRLELLKQQQGMPSHYGQK